MRFKIGDVVRIKCSCLYMGKNLKNCEAKIVYVNKWGYQLENIKSVTFDEGYLELVGRYEPKHMKKQENDTKCIDNVNHPNHYNQGKYECIDEMIELFGVEAVIGFCKCNIYKYKTRASHKNGDEDLAKADWYMDKLLELERGNKDAKNKTTN